MYVAASILAERTRSGSAETQLRCRLERIVSELAGEKLRPRGSGDHGGVVGGQRDRRKRYREGAPRGCLCDLPAQLAVRRYAPADDQPPGAKVLGCGHGGAGQVACDICLEARDKAERLRIEPAESFNSCVLLARLGSEDPGSAQGGL